MNTKTLLNKNNIRAQVLTNWDKHQNYNCKFTPGQQVKVRSTRSFNDIDKSNRSLSSTCGKTGKVIAVSTPDSLYIRSGNRSYSRYYVAFKDGSVKGYHSYYLTPSK